VPAHSGWDSEHAQKPDLTKGKPVRKRAWILLAATDSQYLTHFSHSLSLSLTSIPAYPLLLFLLTYISSCLSLFPPPGLATFSFFTQHLEAVSWILSCCCFRSALHPFVKSRIHNASILISLSLLWSTLRYFSILKTLPMQIGDCIF